MSYINCERLSDEVWQFNCNLCGSPICTEGKEFLEYIQKTRDRPYCFDCEGTEPDEQPKLFDKYWDYMWFFGVSGGVFDPGAIVEFSEKSGLIAQVWYNMSWVTIEQVVRRKRGDRGGSYACPVVHNSTLVRDNE